MEIREAKAIVRTHLPALPQETVTVWDALGRVLAEEVTAKMNQPPFRRSAMDGYAVRREDLVNTAGNSKNCLTADPGRSLKEREKTAIRKLPVVTEIDAGDTRQLSIRSGEAVRIMTGAMVPEGADLVVPQEMTDYGEQVVEIHELPKRSNICPVGEDFTVGTILAEKGDRVNAQLLSCLVAAGVTELKVAVRPRVAVITTGSELRAPGSTLQPGQIYDANRAYLLARLQELGCEVKVAERVDDSEEAIRESILQAAEMSDYIITAGGVSVGKKDLLEAVLTGLCAEVKFHGIRIKPGMPTMFSLLHGLPVLSLSGNPYAAAALFESLFPYVRGIELNAFLKEPYENRMDTPRLVRGYFDGEKVTLALNQKNGATWTNGKTNCLAEIPGNTRATECRIWLLQADSRS